MSKEPIEEFVPLDGAFIIRADGIVEAAGRDLEASGSRGVLPQGSGSRHLTAAGITAATKALVATIPKSPGAAWIFPGGTIVMEIEQSKTPMAEQRTIRIGCSGWNYPHWRGRFYPQEQPPQEWFGFYARFFDTVEINNTFYQLPQAKTFQAWRAQAPEGFRYAVKANRYLTHLKKLKEPAEPLRRLLDRVRLLGAHLGPILYQLPPHWHLDRQRLEAFLDLLPADLLHVFEFRDRSWMVEEVFGLLEERGVSHCTHDLPGLAVPRRAVGPIAYVRLHGVGGLYQGSYPTSMLRSWWQWMEEQVKSGKDLYVYFNNDAEAHAVSDALRLRQMAGLPPPPHRLP